MPRVPKLTSTYFGDRGSFAYDTHGDFVVLQGYAWIWSKNNSYDEVLDEADGELLAFDDTLLPWAYLTVLNSRVFEDLLESSCPRVQGGQFNLSTRFVNRVDLPDLSDDHQITADLVEELALLGKEIHAGKMPDIGKIDRVAMRAYGLPE